MMNQFSAVQAFSSRFKLAGLLLGFSLGGFFDGILLHQILQWHHLLSSLRGGRFDDIRVQIFADGLFHLLMYAVAIVGLVYLRRTRREFAMRGADRLLLASALIGFGAWHVIDAVVSHWLLGIHRVRMDTDYPLLWDLGWLVLFGLVPIVVGWRLRRYGIDAGPGAGGGSARATISRITAPLLVLLVVVGGPMAALPPPGSNSGKVMIVTRPATTPEQMLDGIAAVNGGLLWVNRSASIWAITLGKGHKASALYEHGALIVAPSAVSLGCLSWITTG